MGARTGRPRLAPIEDSSVEPAEEILIAASKLFARKGFASTTTREIATAAGIRQPSLYYWFPTKFDILNRLVESGIVDSAAFARRIRRAKASAIVRLYALLLFDTRQLVATPYDLSFLAGAPELKDERLTYRPHLATLHDAIEFLLRGAIRDGDIEPIEPKLARMGMLALTGVTMEFRVDATAVEPTVAALVRYAIRGIASDHVDLDQIEAAAQALSKP